MRPHIPVDATGGVPNNEKRINIITLRDLEAEAQKVMAPFGFAYVSGGAGDEWTMRENVAAFNRWVINADFMSGVGSADTMTTILSGPRFPIQQSLHLRETKALCMHRRICRL
jgi:hypothetical protein